MSSHHFKWYYTSFFVSWESLFIQSSAQLLMLEFGIYPSELFILNPLARFIPSELSIIWQKNDDSAKVL